MWPGTPGSWTSRDWPRRAWPASSPPCQAGMTGWLSGAYLQQPGCPPERPRVHPGTPAPSALTPDQAFALVHAADSVQGPQRARTAALVAVLLFTGARVSEIIGADVEDLGTDQERPVLWVTRKHGRRQSLPLPGPARCADRCLPGQPGRSEGRSRTTRAVPPPGAPGTVRHRYRRAAVRRGRMAGRAPCRLPGGPAGRSGRPSRTACDASVVRKAVPRRGRVTSRPSGRDGACRSAHDPQIRPGPERHRLFVRRRGCRLPGGPGRRGRATVPGPLSLRTLRGLRRCAGRTLRLRRHRSPRHSGQIFVKWWKHS